VRERERKGKQDQLSLYIKVIWTRTFDGGEGRQREKQTEHREIEEQTDVR